MVINSLEEADMFIQVICDQLGQPNQAWALLGAKKRAEETINLADDAVVRQRARWLLQACTSRLPPLMNLPTAKTEREENLR